MHAFVCMRACVFYTYPTICIHIHLSVYLTTYTYSRKHRHSTSTNRGLAIFSKAISRLDGMSLAGARSIFILRGTCARSFMRRDTAESSTLKPRSGDGDGASGGAGG